jgi:hypothetical protein
MSNLPSSTGAQMRTSYVLAALAVLSILPAGLDAQQSDRDRRDRERRDRERREEERRDREQERREMEQERRERERERVRARERVTVRVYRDGDQFRRRPPSRNLSLMVGVLNYDFADDDNFPMAALRADWRLTRFLRGEVDASYATGDVPADVATGGERSTSLATATLGVQAELPFRYVRPYVGVAAGLFGRFDEGDGPSFVRPTTAFPVGVRIPFSPRLALRGELRWRFDQHENNSTAVDVEQTAGLSFSF